MMIDAKVLLHAVCLMLSKVAACDADIVSAFAFSLTMFSMFSF